MREKQPVLRAYADTSVFGGVFDDEFMRASKVFFRMVQRGKFLLITSDLVREELVEAPPRVRDFFGEFEHLFLSVEIGRKVLDLRNAYLAAGIVTPQCTADALHVAVATVHSCRILLSWNCRHIVHFQKIPKFNALNKLLGYPEIAIHTPLEVIGDETEEM